jgi:predicted MFS family arabinose efflux permease
LNSNTIQKRRSLSNVATSPLMLCPVASSLRAHKVIRRWFPENEQGRAKSVWMIVSPLGSAIGFPLTITIVAMFGWRASFYALAALNLIIVVPLILAVVGDWPPEGG